MKNILTVALLMFVAVLPAVAQNELQQERNRADSLQRVLSNIEQEKMNQKIWGKGRFTRLGYSKSETGAEFNSVEKSKWSFFLTKGSTYLFPKQPLGGLIKIGVDAVWCDFQVSKYNSGYADETWTSDIENDNSSSEDSDAFDFNIGHMGVSFGMGVGLNVSIAPFALSSVEIMKPLRASLYFHYAPTEMLYIKSQDGDAEISTAFCHMMRFGGTLSYRRIGIGLEGFWGKSNFKPIDFESIIYGEDSGSDKYTRKFANLRAYIQFTF